VFKDTQGIAMCILFVSTTIILFSSGPLVASMQALAFPEALASIEALDYTISAFPLVLANYTLVAFNY
jgi:hypothetical protein